MIPVKNEHVNAMQEKYGYLGYIIYHDGQIMDETNSRKRDSDIVILILLLKNCILAHTSYESF